jgi:hypothetical protein
MYSKLVNRVDKDVAMGIIREATEIEKHFITESLTLSSNWNEREVNDPIYRICCRQVISSIRI